MKKKILSALVAAALALPVMSSVEACTTMIVTAGAAEDGKTFVAHSDDTSIKDFSIVYVPARDWPEGSQRPVYVSAIAYDDMPEYESYAVARLNDKDRAPGYDRQDIPASKPIGYIPQVSHTYAYLDGNYAIVNEKGLMFGECTDDSYMVNNAEAGKRIFYSSELARVALERCATAREAIELMGELAEKYGFYGTGECLPIADATGEAWVMEIMPNESGEGAIWAAQRVPDGEVWVGANECTLREIRTDSPDFMCSKNLEEVLKQTNRRVPADTEQPVDFLRSTCPMGEYGHPYFSLRRVWRAYDLLAPSLHLQAKRKSGSDTYPFSIKPDKKVTRQDIERIYRDHYEGTEFDQTKGIAAGPFGYPYRVSGKYDGMDSVTAKSKFKGAWERTIGARNIGYAYIIESDPHLPSAIGTTVWMALEHPDTAPYLPLAVAPVPESYEKLDVRRYDPDKAWWNYNDVSQHAELRFSDMIKDISARIDKQEQTASTLVAGQQAKLAGLAKSQPEEARAQYAEALRKNAEDARLDWQQLFNELRAKYNHGRIYDGDKSWASNGGYSEEWLEYAGYKQGPTKY